MLTLIAIAAAAALAVELVSRRRARHDHHITDPSTDPSFPEGCCACGTGGAYYRGSKRQVTRYLYTGACGAPDGDIDWASCSLHPLSIDPLVDYGSDVEVTAAEARADALLALAGLPVPERRKHCPCCGHGTCMRTGKHYGDACTHEYTGCGPTCSFARSTCAWCPDPANPDPANHPDGCAEHRVN